MRFALLLIALAATGCSQSSCEARAAQGHRMTRRTSLSNNSSSTTPSAPFSNTYSCHMEAAEGYTLTAAVDTECTNDKFTASVWIKGGIGNSQPWVRPNEWRALYSNALNNLYVYIGNGACSTAQFEYSFGDGSSDDWSHFAWTYDGSQAGNSDKITIYIDGEESEQGVSGTIPSELTHSCGTAMYLNGPAAIDEAYYGCDVLDADDITEMYNGGEPTDSSGLFSDLRVWLRCGDAEGDDETILYNQGSAGNFTSSTVDSDDIVEDVP